MTHCGHAEVLYNYPVLVSEYVSVYRGLEGYYQYVLLLHHCACQGQHAVTNARERSDSNLSLEGLILQNT